MNNYIIYKAQNIFTNETYIGATTRSIDERKSSHVQQANKKECHKFQEAIGTYGSDAFTWEQIDTATSTDELAKKEIQYVYEYNSILNGYNQNRGGGFKKTIYQFEAGTLINSFESLEEAANAINVDATSISHACVGDRNTCNGYYWSYDDTLCQNIDLRKKNVSQFNLNGEYVETYESISVASSKTGINKSSIAKCCRGERKQAGGFLWKLKKDN